MIRSQSLMLVTTIAATSWLLGCSVDLSATYQLGSSAQGGAANVPVVSSGTGSSSGHVSDHAWALEVAAPGDDWVAALASTAAGHVVMAGAASPLARIGEQQLNTAGGNDIVVADIGADGGVTWASTYGGAGDDAATAIATHVSGKMGITGRFEGVIGFAGSHGSYGHADVFITILSGIDGAPLRSLTFGSAGDDSGRAIVFTEGGDIVIAGQHAQDMAVLSTVVPAHGTGADAFVASFDADLSALNWVVPLTCTGSAEVYDMARAPDGRLVAVGSFTDSLSVAGKAVSATGAKDMFVVSLNAAGELLWLRSFGAGADDVATSVAIDRQGRTYVAATFEETVSFDDVAVTSKGYSDVAFIEFAALGSVLRAVPFGGSAYDRAGGLLAGDGTNCPNLTMHFSDSIEIDGRGYQSNGLDDVLILGIDEAGLVEWSHQDGGAGHDIGSAITYANGYIVLGGAVQDATVDYGVAVLGGKGGLDGLVTAIKVQ